MVLLEVRGLTKYFGGLAAVSALDFDINQGEILGLIGPNGAGKTTVFNLLTGFCRPTSGTVTFKGHDISGFKPDYIAKLGLVRTFQADTLFRSKTVFDNIIMAQHLQQRAGFFSLLVNSSSARREESESQKRAIEILERIELAEVKGELAGSLPHGFQRALGVAVALAADPELLLLDEPITGMSAGEAETTMRQIQRIRDQGLTVFLVEHDMKAVMNTCDRIIVLNFGKKIAEGLPESIKENKDVIESYLGFEEGE